MKCKKICLSKISTRYNISASLFYNKVEMKLCACIFFCYIQGKCDTRLCDFRFYRVLSKSFYFSVLNTRVHFQFNILLKTHLLPKNMFQPLLNSSNCRFIQKGFSPKSSGFTLFPCLTLE